MGSCLSFSVTRNVKPCYVPYSGMIFAVSAFGSLGWLFTGTYSAYDTSWETQQVEKRTAESTNGFLSHSRPRKRFSHPRWFAVPGYS